MTPCLPYASLENHASGATLPVEESSHLASCADCRERLEDVRANNRFLSRFDSTSDASMPLSKASALEPDAISGYSIRRVVGSGGQGIVYEAVQASTLRRVALKVMLYDSPASGRRQQRFEREILLASELRHPGIVTLYDSGVTSGGRLYFAMEFVEGVPIDRYVGIGGVESAAPENLLPVADTLRLFAKVCEAVRHAHQRGIIHRDLKPGNILVDRDGEPHVLDFGLAKRVDAPKTGSDLTLTGAWQGTIAYAAPEQVGEDRRAAEDTRTDVHALGLVLYEILTGTHPFNVTGTLPEILRDVKEKLPAPPSSVRPKLGGEIDTIVLKALSKEPERRYESAAALLEDIRRFEENRPISARRDSTLYLLRKIAGRHRRTVIAALLFLLSAVALGAWIVSAERRATEGFRKASDSASALATRLAESEIERGRATGQPQAQALIWRHHLLKPAPESADGAREMNDPPGRPLSYWALFDLYRRHPCLGADASRTAYVNDVAIAGESGAVLDSRVDGTVGSWDALARGGARTLFTTDASTISRFSGDAKRLAVANGRGVKILDVERGGVTIGAIEAGAPVALIALNGDGTRVAVGTTDHDVAVFDVRSSGATLAYSRPKTRASIPLMELSADGRLLAVRLGTGEIEIVDVATGARSDALASLKRSVARGRPAFDPDGESLLAAVNAEDPTSPVWECVAVWRRGESGGAADWTLDARLVTHMPYFGDVELRGAAAAAAQRDRVAFFDLASAPPSESSRFFGGHESEVTFIAASRDAGRVASVDRGGALRLWEPSRHAGRVDVPGTTERSYHSAAYSPDGRFLAASGSGAGGVGGVVRIFPASSLGEVIASIDESALVSTVAWAPRGDRLAIATHEGVVRTFRVSPAGDVSREHEIRVTGPVASLAFLPNGESLAIGAAEGALLYSPRLETPVVSLAGHTLRVPSVACRPGDDLIATGCMDRAIRLYRGDASGGEVLGEHASGVRVVRFAPNGRLLASAGDDGRVRVWDTERRRPEWTLEGHEGQVFALAWSPDGSLLASGDSFGAIRLWDVRIEGGGGTLLATLERGRSMLANVEFSPGDGRYLVAASLTGGLSRWDLRHYDRHMAGNLECEIARLEREGPLDSRGVENWRRWADRILEASRPSTTPRSERTRSE